MRKHLLFVLVTCIAALAYAEDDVTIEARIYNKKSKGTMPYRILKPANYDFKKKYPLVMCLHGAGGRGTDNMSRGTEAFIALSKPEVQKEYPHFLLTPQIPGDATWHKNVTENPMHRYIDLALEVLKDVQKEFSIDPSRIYVTGQSMGGFGTWYAIETKPQLFAAAIPICGGGDPGAAQKLKNMPIWVFHGAKDTIISPEKSRVVVEAIKKRGSKVIKYTEYPDCGHGSWGLAWQEKELIPWLFKQKK
jgi:predicted peptidase